MSAEDPAATVPATAPGRAERQAAVLRAVRELEHHVAAAGWDGPVRLFALVRTAGALARDPDLAGRLPSDVVDAARTDPEHITIVEQESLPQASSLEELLGGLAWPDTVDGAAVVTERIVIPPEAEARMPADPEEALAWLGRQPERREVRLAVAALRDGTNACAIRTRDHDRDADVAAGPDLVPGLVAALTATLT
ncbi:MAG: PPA1309 family protein [Kineosporiaceae bacterium]